LNGILSKKFKKIENEQKAGKYAIFRRTTWEGVWGVLGERCGRLLGGFRSCVFHSKRFCKFFSWSRGNGRPSSAERVGRGAANLGERSELWPRSGHPDKRIDS